MRKVSFVKAGTVACLLVLGTFVFLLREEPLPAPTHDVAALKAVNESMHQTPFTKAIEAETLPSSLKGLESPAEAMKEKDNHLFVSAALRDMFDYYLATLGEVDLEQVISMIQSEIHQHLAEPARSEALSLLKRYIDYKIALVDFKSSAEHAYEDYSQTERIIQTQRALMTFRQGFFDMAEYDAFFAEEDAYNAFMIEQLRIRNNAKLSEAEKNAQLAQAENMLPPRVKASRERSQAHLELRQQINRIKADGGSDAAIYALRSQTLGPEAAEALRVLDDQRQAWQQRLAHFAEARSQILQSGLSAEDRASAIELLLADNFQPGEHKRVRALMNDGRLEL